MDIIFEEMSKLVPLKSVQKFRKDKDFLIVTTFNNEYHFLNEVATDIFLNCNGIFTIMDIYNIIKQTYEVDDNLLKKDLINIIRDFQWNHLIELAKY